MKFGKTKFVEAIGVLCDACSLVTDWTMEDVQSRDGDQVYCKYCGKEMIFPKEKMIDAFKVIKK